MTYQWVSASLLTGTVVADLPSFEPDWPLRRVLSDASVATGVLHLDGAPENWRQATVEGGSVLACYDDADVSHPIVWAGYVSEIPSDDDYGTDDMALSLSSFEGYLARRFVTDRTYPTTTGWRSIVADVVTSVFSSGDPSPALSLGYTAGGAKPVEPLVMQNADNASLKDRLDQLCAQFGGEYTVEWSWANNGTRIVPTLYFAERIGQRAVGAPAVSFDYPGNVASFKRGRSYAAGSGANKIVAYSSGQGDTTPYAPAVWAADMQGRPTFEERYQPAPSISPGALGQYARQAIVVRSPGVQVITVSVASGAKDVPQLGVDYRMGDDLGYQLSPVDADGRRLLKVDAAGESGVARMIAYDFDPTTVTPTFAQTDVYVQAG